MIMNIQECDILNTLISNPYVNQRILAEISGHSLGIVNRSIKSLIESGYLDANVKPHGKGNARSKHKISQKCNYSRRWIWNAYGSN